jgi:predicted Zn-dependent protease
MKYTPRQPETNVNVTPTSPVKEFFVLTGGLVAIAIGVYFLLGLAVNLIVPHLSVDFEKKLAGALMPTFEQEAEFKEQEAYLQSLVDSMQRQCASLPYEFKVHFNEAAQFNAVALPGGHIIIFSGLFKAAAAENELSFVLAHEMGHYANRDHLKAMGRGLVLMAISSALFGADSGLSGVIGNGLSLTELSFSREQETAADAFALAALNCTYGHINGALQFMQKFPKEADPGDIGHYFSSHPEVERRMAHLEDIIRSNRLHSGKLKPLPSEVIILSSKKK